MTHPARPLHFLLVEDDPDHADLVLMSLRDNNVANTIDHVRDGEAALNYLAGEGEHANAARPDVIMLDLKLPRLSGLEVLDRVKADERFKAIPVIVMTTSNSEPDRVEAYRLGANSYINKPANFEAFQKMVRDLGLYWTIWNASPVSSLGC